jgi:multidrug efflux pump subunit AcrB
VIREAVIGTPHPGALPTRVADEVTDVIEDAMQQLKEVTSVSGMGMSRVKVEIDLPFAQTRDAPEQLCDKLRRKVEDARRSCRPGPALRWSTTNSTTSTRCSSPSPATATRWGQIRDYVEVPERELVLVPGMARAATLVVVPLLYAVPSRMRDDAPA